MQIDKDLILQNVGKPLHLLHIKLLCLEHIVMIMEEKLFIKI